MNLDDIKLCSVKYQMKVFTIDAGGTTLDVPISQIASIKIEKNFETTNYPFFYIVYINPFFFFFLLCHFVTSFLFIFFAI